MANLVTSFKYLFVRACVCVRDWAEDFKYFQVISFVRLFQICNIFFKYSKKKGETFGIIIIFCVYFNGKLDKLVQQEQKKLVIR